MDRKLKLASDSPARSNAKGRTRQLAIFRFLFWFQTVVVAGMLSMAAWFYYNNQPYFLWLILPIPCLVAAGTSMKQIRDLTAPGSAI